LEQKNYWEDLGVQYEQKSTLIPWAGPITNKYIRYTQKDALQRVKNRLQDKKVLEIGCGTAYWFDYWRQWGAKDIWGIDISRPILKLAGTEKVIQASAQHLPFRSDIFDMVITITALQHLPSKDELESSMKEISRILKGNGGQAILLEQSSPHSISLFAPLLTISKAEWENLFPQYGFELMSSYPVDPSASLFAIDLLAQRMAKLIWGGKPNAELGQILSPHSKLVRLYYFVKEASCLPSFLGLKVAKKFYPKLATHWLYILERKDSSGDEKGGQD
jgi:ubiquinone/menaquinone biosynthesis C-methylase UbiE